MIVNKSVMETSIKKSAIMKIYLGKKKKWSDGQWINAAVLRKGSVRNEFLTTYVSKTASNYYSFWRKQIVTGTGIPPKAFKFEKDIIDYVAQKKGAIGYISSDTTSDLVKILPIEMTGMKTIANEN